MLIVGFLPAGFGPIDSTPVKKPVPRRGQAHGANIPMITELGKYEQGCHFFPTGALMANVSAQS